LGALSGLVSFLVSAFFVIRVDSLEVAAFFWIFIAMIMSLSFSRVSERSGALS
jgi:hypothetical protein